MGGWMQDIGTALRGVRRRPAFSAGVAVTLGLGIGATTTIYSVVDAVLVSPLPFSDAARLASVGATFPTREWADAEGGRQHLAGIGMLNLRDYVERNRSFEALAGIEMTNVLLRDEGMGPELATAARVDDEFFEMFDISPALGRGFLPEEHSVASGPVVILSHGAWQRRFGGDPDVVGRALGTEGAAPTVVGILPRDIELPEAVFRVAPDFWLPLVPDHPRYADRGMRSLYVTGRLRPDTDVEEARAEARAIAGEIATEHPDGNVYPDGSHFGIGVNGLKTQTIGSAAGPLAILLGAAGLLLALASMNAATLLLARSLDRVRELGVRRALGAGRGRVVRLLLTEAGVLALAGGMVGVVLAYVGVELFVDVAPSFVPRVDEIALDGRVLAVAVLTSLGAGLAAGIAPAVRLTRGAGRGLDGARGEVSEPVSRLRALLVGSQVAVAVVLVSGAVLLSSSFLRIVSTDPGFDPDGLVTMRVDLKRPGAPPDEASWQGWDGALAALASVPGVESVAGATDLPFQSPSWAPRLLLPGDPPDMWREGIAGYAVTPGYFETMDARIVAGRGIRAEDGPTSTRVALVNEAFVREVLSGVEPLGLTMRWREDDSTTELRVVGVVGDMVQSRTEEGYLPAVYVPHTQSDWPFVHAAIRSRLPPEVMVPELRAALARFSPAVPPRGVGTLEDRMTATRADPWFQTVLALAFAVVALSLASLGLYGSVSHAVGRRRREIGIRMTLGARGSGVVRLVMAQGMRVVAGGLLVGLLSTVAVNRLLEAFLFGVAPDDPALLLASTAILAAVTAVASAVPARRATSVDPVQVLRSD